MWEKKCPGGNNALVKRANASWKDWPSQKWNMSEPLYSSAPNVLWASARAIQSLLDTASRLFLGSQRTSRKHY